MKRLSVYDLGYIGDGKRSDGKRSDGKNYFYYSRALVTDVH